MSDYLESLTPAQREAVEHVEGPLLILAGPGSGKTRVVTHRIAYLLHCGIPARQILALTFTNKAADEMKGRVERLAPSQPVWVGTFHRFCARLLRQYAPLVGLEENYTIYDAADSAQALRRTIEALGPETLFGTPDQIGAAISWAKNNLITAGDYTARPGHAIGTGVARVYPAYQARLLGSNAADFDDLLLHVATLLRENPEVRRTLDERFRFILVDEYQDTNLAQYTIVRALSIDHPNLAVTGDPDQSIYGWRGASIRNILEFEHDFPNVHVVRLEQNYRSTKRILRVAARLISYNVRRKKKDLFTDNDEGRPVRLVTYANNRDEADGIAERIAAAVRSGRRRARDFAIFYRINALSRTLEFALRGQGIPYQMVNGLEFYQRKEIKDVLAYLHLINNPRSDVALERIINTPARGISKPTVQHLRDFAAASGLTLLEAARRGHEIASLNKRAVAAVARFVAMFDQFSSLASASIEEILGNVLSASGYQQHLVESGTEEDQERLANTQELLTAAREFDDRNPGEGRLEAFLEEVSLVNDTDPWEETSDRVTLMTLHASKGLEFPVVFIVAVEQGLLPHERCVDHPDQLEEERRLLFVGITRAQEELQLSTAASRAFRGQTRTTVPSSFLMELPRDEMQLEGWAEPRSWEDFEEPEYAGPRPAPETLSTLRLTTAAELAGQRAAPAVSPDAFHQGMLVRHPEYGLGKVVALSGAGSNRRATVDFTPSIGRKKFVLEQSPLRPVKSS
ncbi:MAG: ATP-dependent helicase [Pirellulales bacterium]